MRLCSGGVGRGAGGGGEEGRKAAGRSDSAMGFGSCGRRNDGSNRTAFATAEGLGLKFGKEFDDRSKVILYSSTLNHSRLMVDYRALHLSRRHPYPYQEAQEPQHREEERGEYI